MDFQETNFFFPESWILGFPQKTNKPTWKLYCWIPYNQNFFSNILFEHERSAFRAHAGDYFHDFNSEFAKRAALYFHGISAAVQTKLMKNE